MQENPSKMQNNPTKVQTNATKVQRQTIAKKMAEIYAVSGADGPTTRSG